MVMQILQELDPDASALRKARKLQVVNHTSHQGQTQRGMSMATTS